MYQQEPPPYVQQEPPPYEPQTPPYRGEDAPRIPDHEYPPPGYPEDGSEEYKEAFYGPTDSEEVCLSEVSRAECRTAAGAEANELIQFT